MRTREMTNHNFASIINSVLVHGVPLKCRLCIGNKLINDISLIVTVALSRKEFRFEEDFLLVMIPAQLMSSLVLLRPISTVLRSRSGTRE